MDDPKHESIINPSQGIHLVVGKEFLPGEEAILIPRTDDGRVLFAVPWHDKIVLGTTDTPVDHISNEPVPQEDEIDFILEHMGRYLSRDPQRSDVKSMFAGLRPLVKGKTKKTAALSRDHFISFSESGMITITGGKWTTYRKMAEDVLNLAIERAGLNAKPCQTKELMMKDCYLDPETKDDPVYLEERFIRIKEMSYDDKSMMEKIHPSLNTVKGEIVFAVREEMCMTVEDALSRRTRALLLDAKAAIEAAPLVANIVAKEMKKDEAWIKNEIDNFNMIAANYLPGISKLGIWNWELGIRR